ncbi:MAG: hypothetical protein ACYS4W_08825 [Planctomycetota bacterium]
MFNIFEQYWTLLIAAVITWRVLDAVFSEKHSWWQWLLLLLLLAAAYALDRFTETGTLNLYAAIILLVRLLLTAAIVILLAVPALQPFLLRDRRWWLWLLPPCLALLAFGSDWLVKTDLERINALIKAAMKAVEEENCDAVAALIAPDYTDTYHNNKESLMSDCRQRLSGPVVDKNTRMGLKIKLSPPAAAVTLAVLTTFDPKGYVHRDLLVPSLLTKVELTLQKQPNKEWLIGSAEILQINRQPAGWRNLR